MPLRMLVIGGGSIGTRHARNLLSMNAGDVVVCEPEERRRAAIASELGVRVAANEDEALATRPDIVFVCSPTALHVPQARKAVEAGAHIFIEKPLSHSMDGVKELRAAAEGAGRIVMMGCNMRFHPGHAAIHRFLANGAIGTPIAARLWYSGYLPFWRTGQDYRKSYSADPLQGGAVLDCIHEIDLAFWHFGAAKVAASSLLPAANIGLETDGLAEILLRHESGVLSSVHVNFIERENRRFCHVIGTEGSLDWNIRRGTVKRTGRDGTLAEEVSQGKDWTINDMYLDEIRHFLAAVKRRAQPFNSLDETMHVLAIALEVRNQ
jgi:predicted dehydrogenase